MNVTQVIITLIVLAVLGAAAIGVFAFGGEDTAPQTAQDAASATATQQTVTPTAETPSSSSAPSPTEVSVALSQEPPDRDNCDDIRGTDYHSPAEREFFLANCLETPAPVTASLPATTPMTSVESDASCEKSVEIVTSRSDQTYSVSGANLDEVADSLDANAPLLEGSIAYGLTEYSYGLDGSYCLSAGGSCHVGQITISADIIVTLPLLTSHQLSGDALQIWTAYAEQVTLHENRHVRILEEGLAEIKRQLLTINDQPNCDRIDHEVDKVWTLGGSQIEQRQRSFHIADARGQGGLVVQ